MGNGTHAPPAEEKKYLPFRIPNVELDDFGWFWYHTIIITTKPLSSVARWCLGNDDYRHHQATELSGSVVPG